MLSFSRMFLVVAVTSFLTPCFCPAMVDGCKDGLSLSASNCQQNQTAPCCNHSCCNYTNHAVVSKTREAKFVGLALVFLPSNETFLAVNGDRFLVSRPKIRILYHPEYSQVLRL